MSEIPFSRFFIPKRPKTLHIKYVNERQLSQDVAQELVLSGIYSTQSEALEEYDIVSGLQKGLNNRFVEGTANPIEWILPRRLVNLVPFSSDDQSQVIRAIEAAYLDIVGLASEILHSTGNDGSHEIDILDEEGNIRRLNRIIYISSPGSRQNIPAGVSIRTLVSLPHSSKDDLPKEVDYGNAEDVIQADWSHPEGVRGRRVYSSLYLRNQNKKNDWSIEILTKSLTGRDYDELCISTPMKKTHRIQF